MKNLEVRVKELEKELHDQRFYNKHNLSIDQKIADKISKLEAKVRLLKMAETDYRDYLELCVDLLKDENYVCIPQGIQVCLNRWETKND